MGKMTYCCFSTAFCLYYGLIPGRGPENERESRMFVMSNLIAAIAGVLEYFLTIYMWIVIIAALISWINPDPYNPIVRFLYSVTEPVFGMVRRVLPLPRMGIDISPLIVFLAIIFLQMFLVETLKQIAGQMR
jgi:YggT family protein